MKHGLADGWQRRRSLIGRWPMTAETGTLGWLPWLVSGLETSGGAEAGADGAETSCWDKSGLRAISGCGSLGARMHAGEVWALAALATRTGTSRTLATPTQGTSAGAGEGWAWGAHFPWNWYGWRSWHSCDLRMSNKLWMCWFRNVINFWGCRFRWTYTCSSQTYTEPAHGIISSLGFIWNGLGIDNITTNQINFSVCAAIQPYVSWCRSLWWESASWCLTSSLYTGWCHPCTGGG